MSTISFQELFSDLSTLLLMFPDITGETTIEEFLIWLKDILEADEVEFILEENDEGQSYIQLRLPGFTQ